MTRIAVVGKSGKMGEAIIKLTSVNNDVCLSVVLGREDNLSAVLDKFDILIDFTSVKSTMKYLNICLGANKAIVIGTTGFNKGELKTISSSAEKIPIVLAANMSIGINLVFKLLNMVTKIIGTQSNIKIVETHHRDKIDTPSGTALEMGDIIAKELDKDLKTRAVYDRYKTKNHRNKHNISFSSIRDGNVVGEHTISFFMDNESVEITHKAFSRTIFASGAVSAASWLSSRPKGLYSMQNVLGL